MENPLKKYFRGATLKLPFLDMQFGPGTPPQQPVAGDTPPLRPSRVNKKLAKDPFDLEMKDEPEPDQVEPPVSLKGSDFERALLSAPEVIARLSHSRDEHVARRAVEFFLEGIEPDDEGDRDSKTWKQIRAVCVRLIIEMLDRHHQRATYGAVGGIVGLLARSVMYKKPKNQQNSWVVAKATNQPTGFADAEKHQRLNERTLVLVTPNYLREWLRNPT